MRKGAERQGWGGKWGQTLEGILNRKECELPPLADGEDFTQENDLLRTSDGAVVA